MDRRRRLFNLDLLTSCVAAFLAVLLYAPASAEEDAPGAKIYREGQLPSGEQLTALVQKDIAVKGKQFRCAACHRASGFGSLEGSEYVPPVTAPVLFAPTKLDRADKFRRLFLEVQEPRTRSKVRGPTVRPAYTRASLARAIRTGVDPTGRSFSPLMPRYEMSDEDMDHLLDYLEGLSTTPDEGVDENTVDFATVVADGVPAGEQDAMLEVMKAYFHRKNIQVHGELIRPGHSLHHRDDFFRALRKWRLHVWDLTGPRETWGAQLAEYYKRKPVFAVLSGMVPGSWAPIGTFCTQQKLPCLFPNTKLPEDESAGGYTLYLSKGLSGEAAALAKHFAKRARLGSQVLQVHTGDPAGQQLARRFKDVMTSTGAQKLQTLGLGKDANVSAEQLQQIANLKPEQLVIWSGAKHAKSILQSVSKLDRAPAIYLSATLADPQTLAHSLEPAKRRVSFTYPYALPGKHIARSYRIRAWLRSRRIKSRHEHIQFNTHFALSVADHAMKHLVEHFHRDYFIETTEHEVENALNPGVYPSMSLGPGQRYASRGSYIVQTSLSPGAKLTPVSGWIVP